MSQLSEYLSDPDWVRFMQEGLKAPNNGYMRRWIQGSPGAQSPMQIYSNEYSFLRMKHGQNNLLPYRGGIQKVNDLVDSNLQNQVQQCSLQTLNPAGCQMDAIRYVIDAKSNPHPYGLSYETGRGYRDSFTIPPLPRNSNLL